MDAAQQAIQRLAAAMREELGKSPWMSIDQYLENVIANLERDSDVEEEATRSTD